MEQPEHTATPEVPGTTSVPDSTTTVPPAETSYMGEGDSPFDHNWQPLPVLMNIDGVDYYPPTEHEEPVEIFLKDGSIATLSYQSLKIGSRVISIPDNLSTKSDIIDGIQFSPRTFSTLGASPGGGHGVGAGPFDIIKGIFESLSTAAGPLAVAVADFGGKAMSVALSAPGGPLFGTEFGEAIELQDLTQDAIKIAQQVSDFHNQLDSARMFQVDLGDLFEPINKKVFHSYPFSRPSVNFFKSVAQMLQNLPNMSPELQSVVTQRFGAIFTNGMAAHTGFAVAAYNVYAILNNINWNNVVIPVAGGQRPSSSTAVISATSTTTTATTTPTATAENQDNGGKGNKGIMLPIPTGPTSVRVISTKPGAVSTFAFREFAKWLDGTSGLLSGAEEIMPTYLAWPSYMTNLTSIQEAAIRKIYFVRHVTKNYVMDSVEYDNGFTLRRQAAGDPPVSDKLHNFKLYQKRDTGERLGSASHLNILSGNVHRNYKYEPSLGAGITIFIVDTGFNTGHQELAKANRNVEAWYVGNRAVFEGNIYHSETSQIPDNTEDYAGLGRVGHGSAAACVAGGRNLGVASNANLYLIKYKGDARLLSGNIGNVQSTLKALHLTFHHILDKVVERNLQGKSVVNFSFDFPLWHEEFEIFQRFADQLGMVFVMAAGNEATMRITLGDHVPQLMGTKENHLITVGGVNADGTLWHNSEPEGEASDAALAAAGGGTGSVTIYAQGSGIKSCNGDSSDSTGTSTRDGTSFAAPAVYIGFNLHSDFYIDLNFKHCVLGRDLVKHPNPNLNQEHSLANNSQ
ncbi:hypothetical protein EsH8_VII_000361 [Colletotrichum jinshuiense]